MISLLLFQVAILDGVGIAKASDTNAVHLANTPTLDALVANKVF